MAEQKLKKTIDELLGKTSPRHEPEVEDGIRDSFEGARDSRARGRSSLTLDVRLADNSRCGFSYAYLLRTDYEPGDSIRLHFAQAVILIEGRKLAELYNRLIDHREPYVQAGTPTEEALKPSGDSHIESISIIGTEEKAA